MDAIVKLPDALKKLPKESDAAHSALIHFYELGPGRSISALNGLFKDQVEGGIPVPTESYHTLSAWSSRFGWGDRIEAVQQEQYAAEIEALHAARIKFVNKQIDMLSMWEKMLIMGQPNLDDVGFDKWSKSAKDFVGAIGQVFGLENRGQEINVNVNNNEQGSVDANRATDELLGLIKSVRERAELDAHTGNQGIIDVESGPVRQDGESIGLDSE